MQNFALRTATPAEIGISAPLVIALAKKAAGRKLLGLESVEPTST
ncbi:hypothetical protein [Oryzicola mucosus]|nr:hypothetical protein [Oryzicola mucosus]